MATPITRHQRELSSLAIVIAQQQDTIDGLQAYLKRLHDAKEELAKRTESLNEERTELLAENERMRAELETVRKLSELYRAQSIEFCAKYEDEEKRAIANFKRAMDCDMLRKEAEDDLRTIGELRAEVKRLKKAKAKP